MNFILECMHSKLIPISEHPRHRCGRGCLHSNESPNFAEKHGPWHARWSLQLSQNQIHLSRIFVLLLFFSEWIDGRIDESVESDILEVEVGEDMK